MPGITTDAVTAPPARLRAEIAGLRHRAVEERRRADRAATLAGAYLAQAANGPDRLRSLYSRLAQLHDHLRGRHLAAARLHETYARQLEQQARRPRATPASIVDAVADTLGVPAVAVALYSQASRTAILVDASERTAAAAYDLEAEFGEGPARTTMSAGRPVAAAGAALPARWPGYGRAAQRLGVHSVTAVPLQVPAARLGVLCCYGTGSATSGDIATTVTVAAALIPILLRAAPANCLPALIEAPRGSRGHAADKKAGDG